MFSRVTLLEVDVVRTTVKEALGVFNDRVLPELRSQPGYEGVYVFANAEGRGMIVSFWSSDEAATAPPAAAWYSRQLEEHLTLFRSPPGRESYEVLFADAPVATPG
jgi:hypothetical protein